MLKPKRKKGAKRPEVFMFLALEFLLLFTEVELLEAFNFIVSSSLRRLSSLRNPHRQW